MQHMPRQAPRRRRRATRRPPAATGAPGALRTRVLAIVRGEQPAAGASRQARTTRHALAAGAAVGGAVAVLALVVLASAGPRPRRAGVTRAPGAHAALHRVGAHTELVISRLSQPPPGEVYQVWILQASGEAAATDALFTPTGDGDATVEVPGAPRGAGVVMVTREPRGGSVHPTSPSVLTLALAPAR